MSQQTGLHDVPSETIALVEGIVHEAVSDLSIDPVMVGITVEIIPPEYLPSSLGQQGRTFRIERKPHPSEGAKCYQLEPFLVRSADDYPALRYAVTTWLGEYVRLERRYAAIRTAGHDVGRAPAWSYVMDSVAQAIIRYAGEDPAHAAEEDRADDDWVGDPWIGIKNALERRTVHAPRLNMNSSRSMGDRSWVRFLGLLEDRKGNRIFSVCSNEEPTLYICGHMVPTSVLPALPGMRLGDIIDHPALASCSGIIVCSATHYLDGTMLTLKGSDTPLAPAPPGTDLGWMRPEDRLRGEKKWTP